MNSRIGGTHAFADAYAMKDTVPTNGMSESHSVTETKRDSFESRD